MTTWRFDKKRWNSFVCLVLILILSVSSATPAKGQNEQQKKIAVSGTVTDPSGETLIGVTVIVEGTSATGTVTDFDGKYSLPDVPSNATLVFKSVGMKPKSIAVNNNATIDVVLEEDTHMLNETIVIGYGSVKKSDLTGSVASIKTGAIKDLPANSIDGLLQGRAAGLQVITNSQDPGAAATVRIRGGSSLKGSNAPLLVVDGFPMGDAGDLKQINPADIQSIEVLKDASASAIYGSKGANGVIMITTTKAKSGATKVNIKHQLTMSQFSSKLVYWDNPALMAQLDNEDRINGGREPQYIGATNAIGVYYPSISEIESGAWGHLTRWDDVVFRDVPVSNNTTASVSSANKTTSFNLNVNYFDEQGKYVNDNYKKGIVRLGVDHEIYKNFTLRTSNSFSKNWRNNNGGLAYWRNPLWPVYNEEGSYFLAGPQDFDHPVAITDHQLNKSDGLDYISSWLADYQALSWLNFKSQINYKYGATMSDSYFPKKYTYDGFTNNGVAGMKTWRGETFSSENYMTIDKTFNEKHKFNAMLGHSYESSTSRETSMNSYDFVNEALQNENMNAGNPEKNRHSNNLLPSKLLSFMGRLNYTFDDKYLFTATMRADASSKFGANNRWAYFPSTALSWKAHNESFIKSLNMFDELKFRLSYGVSGNQGLEPYQTLSRYGVEQYYRYNDQNEGNWVTAIGPGYVGGYYGDNYRFREWVGIPNKDIKWESTAQTNFGVDMAFFDRRLRSTIDLYVKNTYDLLRQRWLNPSSAFDRMWINDGDIRNQGIELSVEGDIISSKDFNLTGNLIVSKNKSKVTNLGSVEMSGLNVDYMTGMEYDWYGRSAEIFRQNPNILAVGQPINVFYGYKVAGIVQTEKEGLDAGLEGVNAKPGEFKYVDISGDGKIDEDDRCIIGDPNPDFTASLGLSGNYKKFDFEIFFNGVFGNDVLYQNKWGGQPNTMPLRWTVDNPNNEYPSLRNGRSYKMADWYIEDGSFVRIQNISIGYNYTPKIKQISRIRFSANAANLYTFTKFKGYDPEVDMDGVYNGGYPRLRKWTLGIDITF